MGRMSKKTPTNLERQLREAIAASGMPYIEIERRSGVPRSNISRFMRGTRSLTARYIGLLVEALGLELAKKTKTRGRKR